VRRVRRVVGRSDAAVLDAAVLDAAVLDAADVDDVRAGDQ
jgi:hypothetical protein